MNLSEPRKAVYDFDELLHHVRRISLERVTDNEADNLKKMKILRDTAK